MYFYLKEPKATKETVIYIIYYVKENKRNFKYSTGQKVNPKDWNADARMPKLKKGSDGKRLKHISLVLSNYTKLIESTIKDFEVRNEPLSIDKLRKLFDKEFKNQAKYLEKSKSITDAIQDFIDSKNKSKGQSDSWNQKYKNLKNKVELFGEVDFDKMNSDWIDSYSGFLREVKTPPFKPHNDNTLHRNINFLFTFLLWAKGKYHDIDMATLKNPIKKYQPEDVYLTFSELELIEKIKLPRESLNRVRDMFLIGVYSGQRFSDYSVFEKADVHGNLIIKKAEKTENESFIPLHDKLKKLLDKYKWNLPKISSQKFNPHIKEICGLAGIDSKVKSIVYRGDKKDVIYKFKCDMVSSHTARRTFITLSSEKGMPDHIIMKVCGIKDPKTLTKYKKTTQNSVVNQVNMVWG